MCPRRVRAKAKIAAPTKVNARLSQYAPAAMRIHADQNGDRGTQCGNLRQCQVHEDDATLDHVNAQVGVNAGQDEAGQKRRQQKGKNFHESPYCVALKALISSPIS